MTNLQKTLEKIEGNNKVRANLNKARDLFEEKPYAVEYARLHENLLRWGFIPSLLSITGATLFFLTLFPSGSIWWVIPVGAVLATLFEVIKAVASDIGFKAYYSGKRWGLALILPAYIISATLSTWGAYNGYQLLLDHSAKSAEIQHLSGLEKTSTEYEKLISSLENRLKIFEEQHTITSGEHKGKISWGVRGEHANLVNQLSELKAERLRTLEDGKGKLPSVQDNARAKMGAYIYAALGLAILVETIIFLIARFRIFYHYRSHKQVDLLNQGELYQFSINSLRQIATLVQSQEHSTFIPVAERKPMGFTQSTIHHSKNRINTPINTRINTPENKSLAEMIGYLAKYEKVVNDLESGVSIRQTAQNNGVSKSTVQNVSRCIKTLNQHQPFENPNA